MQENLARLFTMRTQRGSFFIPRNRTAIYEATLSFSLPLCHSRASIAIPAKAGI